MSIWSQFKSLFAPRLIDEAQASLELADEINNS